VRRRRTTAGDDGDPAGHRALEALYTAHADRVRAYLLHRTDRETAQDILSETFVLAWRKSGSERLAVMADRTGAAEIGDAIGTRAEVAAALSALSEQDREVLVLSAWYGLTAKQAAVVAGCTATAFAVRLHRARKRFRAALPPAGHAQPVHGALAQPHFTQRESA
jgi:RNA polymerase sigma-70 factor (ECF subfamily)